jgi:hypothetical protein
MPAARLDRKRHVFERREVEEYAGDLKRSADSEFRSPMHRK